jgi:hypothetical protein
LINDEASQSNKTIPITNIYLTLKELKMADAYGMMILNQSENLVCDIDELIESINCYQWNNSGIQWIKNDDDEGGIPILMNCHGYDKVQYPSVFPDEITGVILEDEDGTERFIENPTEEEFENHSDLISDTVSLEDLAKEISQHIKKGQIEIASTCNEKHRYVRLDRLVIKCDGSAYRSRSLIGGEYSEEFSEKYEG